MRLISVQAMKSLENTANQAGYSYAQMMQTAGTGIAKKIHFHYSLNDLGIVIGLVGGGNNGGDTLVALTELKKKGWQAFAVLIKDRSSDDHYLNDFLECGGRLVDATELTFNAFSGARKGILLDGVYGTGFRLPMDKRDEEILHKVKAELPEFTVVAVDCPSGVDCSTGETSPGILKAAMTICLEAVKTGLMTPSAFPYCGMIEMVDLGLEKYSQSQEKDEAMVVGIEDIGCVIPLRNAFTHKGSFGKVIITGGSVNYTGAPILASRGAYAVGAGLVQTAVPEPVYLASAASNLESTWLILDDVDGVISESAVETLVNHAAHADCMVLGPGIGREESTLRFIDKLLDLNEGSARNASVGFIGVSNGKITRGKNKMPPLVIDADALVLMAREKDWANKIPGGAVLTPHPGEMAALTGLSAEEIQTERVEVARKFASQWKQTVVLKGALTVIAGGDGKVGIIPAATSALAKAGTGDVLAGMIGGLLAQGLTPWDAACSAAWIHARAGILASLKVGADESVLATDVIQTIPEIYRSIHKEK